MLHANQQDLEDLAICMRRTKDEQQRILAKSAECEMNVLQQKIEVQEYRLDRLHEDRQKQNEIIETYENDKVDLDAKINQLVTQKLTEISG